MKTYTKQEEVEKKITLRRENEFHTGENACEESRYEVCLSHLSSSGFLQSLTTIYPRSGPFQKFHRCQFEIPFSLDEGDTNEDEYLAITDKRFAFWSSSAVIDWFRERIPCILYTRQRCY
jgi:hypothetical protein